MSVSFACSYCECAKCFTNLSNFLRRVFQRRRDILHTRCCDQTVESLMLLCDLCHGGIEPSGILNVDLAVVN